MKKIVTVILAGAFALSLAACGSSGASKAGSGGKAVAEVSAIENVKEKKILTVYFSADNNNTDAVTGATPTIGNAAVTEYIAQQIHSSAGGDIAAIIPDEDYPIGYDAVADKAKSERDNGERPKFTLSVNPEDYDVIFIGYPVWWYEMPMVMDTFFETYDFNGKTVIPFNTHAGSRDGGTYDAIKELEPNATVLGGFNIAGSSDSGEIDAAVKEWMNGLGF